MAVEPRLMTADELLRLPDDGMRHELIYGELTTMAPPGFEHGSISSQLRAWAGESPFSDLPFTSLLIADNLNDVEPLRSARERTEPHRETAARCA